MTYADAHVRYKQCESLNRVIRWSSSKWLGCLLRQEPTVDLRLSPPPHRLHGRKSHELKRVLKITQYGMVKRKKLWVNIAVCLRLPPSACLSHTQEALTPKNNKEGYVSNEVFWFLPFITAKLQSKIIARHRRTKKCRTWWWSWYQLWFVCLGQSQKDWKEEWENWKSIEELRPSKLQYY